MDHTRGLPGSPTSSETSVLGIISLVHGFVSGYGWFLYFALVGILVMAGKGSSIVNMVIGSLAFAGMFLNLMGVVIGIIGAIRSNGRGMAIAGALLNGLEIAVILAVVALGHH
jgi:hypothetical protein